MNVRRIGKWCSTGLLLIALIGLALPTQAATRGALPSAPGLMPGPTLYQVAAPNPAEINVLNAIAAVPAGIPLPSSKVAQMWAVGYTAARLPSNSTRSTLTMYYDGSVWNLVPSPNLGNESVLTGVTASSAKDVWAVGYGVSMTPLGLITKPLMMHFDGKAWKLWPMPLTPSPSSASVYATLTDVHIVSGASNRDAVAVGYIKTLGSVQPLAYYYSGTTGAWTLMDWPASLSPGRLYAVAGTARTDLWAVGSLVLNGTTVAHLFHYNGKTWTAVAKGIGTLTELAVANGRVFTVGQMQIDQQTQTLVMAYTPKTGDWNQIKTYNVTGDHNTLTALAVDKDKVYAIGYADRPAATGGTDVLVLAYDGQSFLPLTAPNPSQVNELHGAIFTQGAFWAVGTTGVGLQQTLLLTDWCPPCQ